MLTDEELKIAKRKYKKQYYYCRNRVDRLNNPIEFRLTFEEWIDIWISSGHYHERGHKKGQYVMARKHDTGHYEVGNVDITTGKANIIESNRSVNRRAKIKHSLQKLQSDPTYIAKMNAVRNSPAVRAAHQATLDSAEYKAKHAAGMKRRNQNPVYRERNKLAVQKVCNKPISCDGVIYPSIITAALALAPESRITSGSKRKWISAQIKKYPERYFFIGK